MNLSIISFTKNGMLLSERVANQMAEAEIILFTKCSEASLVVSDSEDTVLKKSPVFVEERIGEWARTQMEAKNALLFIGACGIAVRAIASSVIDKLQDSPVLVMDEKGEYIIPILSGHVGGGNEIARLIAGKTGAVPVITTATDINGKFAVDLFAKKNGLHIVNKAGIAKVSSKILAGKPVIISIESGHIGKNCKLPQGIQRIAYPPEQFAEIVVTAEERSFDADILLKPREYIIGLGCRRGKEAEKIEALIEKSMKELGISSEQILAITSIEKKKDEQAFLVWSRKNNVPFITYTSEQLQQVEGTFHHSSFVRDKVGVDNVCERAALKACQFGGKLVYEKHAEDGMTIAIAKREWSVVFDEE